MKAYKIKNWNLHFENSKSRERDLCSWCPIPNKQDGLGYGRLLSMKDGSALYGAFVAVVLVASKQRKPRDGHLTDTGRADGCPLSADDLSIMSKVPSDVMEKMLATVSDASVGWIDTYESGYASARQVPAKCPPATPLLKEEKEEKEEKELRLRLGALFGRRETTAWGDKELKAFLKANPTSEDVSLVEWFYGEPRKNKKQNDPDLWRHDLQTLLNNWTGAVDRARHQKTSAASGGHSDPDNDPLLKWANKTGILGIN
jgi:hypothetical protein